LRNDFLRNDYFRCDIRVEQRPGVLRSGEIAWLRVRVRNAGSGTWLAYAREHVGEVRLVYYWFDREASLSISQEATLLYLATCRPEKRPP
jgi:hypothetical protein